MKRTIQIYENITWLKGSSQFFTNEVLKFLCIYCFSDFKRSMYVCISAIFRDLWKGFKCNFLHYNYRKRGKIVNYKKLPYSVLFFFTRKYLFLQYMIFYCLSNVQFERLEKTWFKSGSKPGFLKLYSYVSASGN